MLLVVGLGFVLNSMWPSGPNPVLGYATDMSSYGLLTNTNEERTSRGLKALTTNSKLATAAQNKAADMAAKDYWSHVSPSGKTPWAFITEAGYSYQTAGENLAYGFATSSDTVTGWMNSSEHRANILNTSYTNIGFGIINIPNYQGEGPQTLVVAMYASPTAVVATKTPTTTKTTTSTSPTSSQPITTSPKSATETKQTTAKPVATANTKPTTSDDTLKAKPAEQSQPVEVAPTQQIARIQLVANGQAGWSLMVTLVIVAVALSLLLVRHGLAWHRLLNRGERFVLHHPLLDIVALSLVTLGVVLSRTVGVIQ